MAQVLANHVRVSLQLTVGPTHIPLSDLQWLLSRVSRLFELSAWAADPGLLLAPERAERQARSNRIPRLPVRYTTGIRADADPQLMRMGSAPLSMTYLMPHTLLWALIQLLRGTEGSEQVMTLSVGDATLWSLQELQEQPDRIAPVQDEFRLRLRQIAAHFT